MRCFIHIATPSQKREIQYYESHIEEKYLSLIGDHLTTTHTNNDISVVNNLFHVALNNDGYDIKSTLKINGNLL